MRCSETLKSTRLAALQLSPESPVPDFSGYFTAQTTASGPPRGDRKGLVSGFDRSSSLCWPVRAEHLEVHGGFLFCGSHGGKLTAPSVDSLYFYGKCLLDLNELFCCSEGSRSTPLLAAFPARLSDLPAALCLQKSFSGVTQLGRMPEVICLDPLPLDSAPAPVSLSSWSVIEAGELSLSLRLQRGNVFTMGNCSSMQGIRGG